MTSHISLLAVCGSVRNDVTHFPIGCLWKCSQLRHTYPYWLFVEVFAVTSHTSLLAVLGSVRS